MNQYCLLMLVFLVIVFLLLSWEHWKLQYKFGNYDIN